MKRTMILTLALVCLTALGAVAQNRPTYPQNENCPGLKNPSNFTFGDGWNGFYGGQACKSSSLSTCTTPGFCQLTAVPNASSLEGITNSAGSCQTNYSSLNIDGVNDNNKRYVIKGPGSDPFTGGNLPYQPPSDTSYHTSIRLGNYCTGGEAEMLTYRMVVSPDNALVTIWYAMSLQYAGHSQGQNPEFSIIVEKRMEDANGNPLYDASGNERWELAGGQSMCYIKEAPTSSEVNNLQPPFHKYPASGSASNIYRDWNKVMVNLYPLMYSTVRIKIAAGDCSQSGHYAACYFAGECGPMKLRANGCAAGESEDVAQINAPKGAISYQWYRSKIGPLTGDAASDENNYVLIDGQTTDTLHCLVSHFVRDVVQDTLDQNSFMCKMTTKMNDQYPIVSTLLTQVGNTKPRIVVDSVLACNADITLTDRSFTPYAPADTNEVDTSATVWTFYRSTNATSLDSVGTVTGGTAHWEFETGGNYVVRVRTTAVDRTCWNEKKVNIRTVKAPVPQVFVEDTTLCHGDTITIQDRTYGSTYHGWTFSTEPDTQYLTPMPVVQHVFDTTTNITLRTRSKEFYMADITGDGLVDSVYCYVDTTFKVYVQEYPKLRVEGDTIVCNGENSQVTVTNENQDECDYNWYYVMAGNTPFIEHNNHLATPLTRDQRYYVEATTEYGCKSWDSIFLYLVNPSLSVDYDKICANDTATLSAGRAAYFEWTSNPPDPSLAAMMYDSVIKVSPSVTTVYSVIGHGSNGCGATALTQKINVYPYPIQQWKLTPDYIDSENPSVQFSDISEYGTSTLWDFGNGNTSTIRTVVFTFTDLSQDSILIKMHTEAAIGCPRDTSFYIPVGIFAVWFPNAFTPKLETNNVFKPFTANTLEDYELYIYDRGGNLVFSTTDIEEGWDGTYKGHDCKQGAYVYIATYRRQGVERLMSQKGTLTLVR